MHLPNDLGVDDVYEAPTNADIVVDITRQTVPEIVHSASDELYDHRRKC